MTDNKTGNLLAILSLVACAILVAGSSAMESKRRIDLQTCAPEGVVGVIKEKVAPRSFWIEQVVQLETSLERNWEWDDALATCRDEGDPSDREKCLAYVEGNHAGAKRCLAHALRMCRLNNACLR